MKRKRKLLSLISALAIPLMLSGCVNKKAEEKKLVKALEERYGEEFVVADSIIGSANWLNVGSLEAACYPKANKNLTFKASYSISNNNLGDDNYIQAIVREEAYEEMEEILSKYYTDFYLDVRVSQPMIEYAEREEYPRFINISDVSIASYEEKYGEKMILSFRIAFNIDEINDYEEVSEIFEEYSKKFTNGRVNFFCYYMDSNAINECKKIEETDCWENFYINSKKNEYGDGIEYVYRFEESKFYLSQITNTDGVKRFNNDGTPIIESEE